MPHLEKFNGTGDPNVHLKMYLGDLRPMGIQGELLGQLFQWTLTKTVLCQFLNLETTKTRTWEDITYMFLSPYVYNTQLDITARELETISQAAKEFFFVFLTRWRANLREGSSKDGNQESSMLIHETLDNPTPRHF